MGLAPVVMPTISNFKTQDDLLVVLGKNDNGYENDGPSPSMSDNQDNYSRHASPSESKPILAKKKATLKEIEEDEIYIER